MFLAFLPTATERAPDAIAVLPPPGRGATEGSVSGRDASWTAPPLVAPSGCEPDVSFRKAASKLPALSQSLPSVETGPPAVRRRSASRLRISAPDPDLT